MTTRAKALAILLWLIGVPSLFALVAVFMPVSWMADTHRWLGLGEMPTAPIVVYLARSVSAFYAFYGAICLLAVSDVDRYRPLISFLGVATVLISAAATVVDLTLGMPWWWTAVEGPPGVGMGALILFLARPDDQEGFARARRPAPE